MSSNNTTAGPSGSQPPRKRMGGKIFIESDDSSSDDDDDVRGLRAERGGGAPLYGSPYRPPQVRAALSKDSLRAKGKGKETAVAGPSVPPVGQSTSEDDNDTPDSTNSDSPIATQLAKLSFQRGEPATTSTDLFHGATSSSGSQSDDTGSQMSITAIDDMVAKLMERRAALAAADEEAAQMEQTAHAETPVGRHMVGNKDAQTVYSHRACLFIANLPQHMSEEALEAEVTRIFAVFGTVYVKVKRDQRDMPFGFLQYTDPADAAEALRHGSHRIFNREVRLEMAKANRIFVVYRRDYEYITLEQVLRLVDPYGELASVQRLSPEAAAGMNIRDGFRVEYARFDPNRELLRDTRANRWFRVAQWDETKPFEVVTQTRTVDQEFLVEYTKGRKSVWVGGLSLEVTEEDLRQLFGEVGQVVDVELKRRHQDDFGSFAIVEFQTPDEQALAIRMLNGRSLRNANNISVQKKIIRNTTPRRATSLFTRASAGDLGHAGQRGEPTPRRDVPSVYVTPHHDHGSSSAGPSSAGPMLASHQPVTPATNAGHTPGGSLLSATAPSFHSSYLVPSPGLSTAFGNFPANPYGGYGAAPFPTYGNPFQQVQAPAAFYGGQGYFQDPVSGMVYGAGPVSTAAPPMIDNATAFAQRSASAVPYVPATQHLGRNSSEGLKPKKSVTFADEVGESSSAQEKDSAA